MAKYQLKKIPDNQISYLLGISVQNFHITSGRSLNIDISEKFLLLESILIHALDTFEGKKTIAKNWLRTPICELDDQTPLQMMNTVNGFSMVNDVLGRLDYGLPA
jgi:putative toxin-antitoxin system antitoxin component (TIGR02293 family)